ncbi:hypothetical protein OKW21_006051 [Catalinimonas alkaloidigena]|uniref:hypothetical protein n=1 Tax=Catalinimonas alkaloidigena TaxID=1075417 RepID=UPI002405B887|nr:hypothetical protein [Catalinimonas alkaloidigena]MDF9800788.1 hypothetical protein [Catalinimonas alkaloidigena]
MNVLTLICNNTVLDLPEDSLNILLNRIVEDLNNPEKRFNDFSYTFNLPKTKVNNLVLNSIDDFYVIDKFYSVFDITVLVNSEKILEGNLKVNSITGDEYEVVLYSKLGSLSDLLEEKTLRDIEIDPISYNYEATIKAHNEAGYDNSQTDYQFPLIFYKTFSVESGYTLTPEQNQYGTYSNIYNSYVDSGNTEVVNFTPYFYFPPSFYVVNLLKKILSGIGWKLKGSWAEDAEINKLILPYAGSADVWERADQYGTLYLHEFLPDNVKQIDFIKGLISMFNLQVLGKQNTLYLERYDSYILPSEYSYNITSKVYADSVIEKRLEDNQRNIAVNFKETADSSSTQALKFNSQNSGYKVTLPFSGTIYNPVFWYNKRSLTGAETSANNRPFSIPYITEQERVSEETHYYDEIPVAENMSYGSGLRILHYEGLPTIPDSENWYYLNMGESVGKVKMTFTSNYQENSTRTSSTGNTINLSYNSADENNLYNKFYRSKYFNNDRGHLLEFDMNMSEKDWIECQPNIPLRYKGVDWRLVEIRAYDPVENIASLIVKRIR